MAILRSKAQPGYPQHYCTLQRPVAQPVAIADAAQNIMICAVGVSSHEIGEVAHIGGIARSDRLPAIPAGLLQDQRAGSSDAPVRQIAAVVADLAAGSAAWLAGMTFRLLAGQLLSSADGGSMRSMTRALAVIGVPCSAGAHHGGLERGPGALRAAGLPDRLRQAGWEVADAGDLTPRVFTTDPAHPRARNRDAVVQACRDVASATSQAIAAGRIPVLVGGDCSITAGAVAGCLARRPDTGLVYLDGDADLRTPQTTIAGNFDGMVIAALLGEGDRGYTGLADAAPMLPPERLAILGYDDGDIDPRERHLLSPPLSYTDGKRVAADPVGAAATARTHVEASAGAIVVHFDVDAVDSADLPLANYPHHGKGLTFEAAMAVLRELCASPAFTALVLTEVNPTHDPAGELLGRYLDGVTAALAEPARDR
jgi:arginase